MNDVAGVLTAFENLDDLDRAECRQEVVARCSIPAMTGGYIDAYQRVLDR
ncbi:MAG TPA: hypothetical protein VF148_12740 [Acidimicrobiia bacterium]